MPSPISGSELLELLKKSNLLDAQRLDNYINNTDLSIELDSEPNKIANRMVADNILTVFQAKQLVRGRYRGFYLGKYKVLEPIGSGGMADVYLCEHTTMKNKVAVKILPPDKLKDPSLLGRFQREARAIAALNHPNIVRAYDLDHEGNLHYMVMEYVDGCNLHDFVKKNGPMDPVRAANYIAQAAAGLQNLFEAGLVHRDVKPGNLLLDRNGVVKLLDLGLARFQDVELQDNLTREFDDGRVLGTADYIAPEQGIREGEVDIRADIYSLGATFFFLIESQAPFEGSTVTQKLLFHQMKAPPALRPGVPPEINQIVQMMMSKKAADRPQLPLDVVEILAPWANSPINAPTDEEMPPRLVSLSLGTTPRSGSPRSSLNVRSVTRISTPAMNSSSSRISGPISGIPQGQNSSRTRITAPDDDEPVVDLATPNRSSPANRVQTPTPVKNNSSKFIELLSNKKTLIGLAVGAGLLLTIMISYFFFGGKTEVKPTATSTKEISRNIGNEQNNQEAPLAYPEGVEAAVARANPPPTAKRVTRSGSAGTFTSISKALQACQAGDKIVVTDPVHEEAINIDGLSGLTDITIEAWPMTNQAIVLRLPRQADPKNGVLRVDSADKFTIKGFVIDAQSRTDHGLHVVGPCEGLILEELQFLNYSKSAILLKGCAGKASKPATLRATRFITSERSDKHAIVIETPDAVPVSNFTIENCKFEGPFASAIAITGQTNRLVVKNNRFFQNINSISYQPATETPDASTVQLQNNVFYGSTQASLFFAVPINESSKWDINNNLFLGPKGNSGRVAYVEKVSLTPSSNEITGQWIWAPGTENSTAREETTLAFRKSFEIKKAVTKTILHVSAKDNCKVWLNGTELLETKDHYKQRVYSLDVTKGLVVGLNTIAIQASNLNDPVSGQGTPAGIYVQLHSTETRTDLLLSDMSWKYAIPSGDGWKANGFNDSAWQPAVPWLTKVTVLPWEYAVWDSSVEKSLGGLGFAGLKGFGNVRDYNTWEGFPNLETRRGLVEQGKDYGISPGTDATFLRFPSRSKLNNLGTDGSPVGIPQ